MSKSDGGPAFPFDVFDPNVGGPEQCEGMSLRDWFAGMALQGLIAGRDWSHIASDDGKLKAWTEGAYLVADAMLAQREKSQ